MVSVSSYHFQEIHLCWLHLWALLSSDLNCSVTDVDINRDRVWLYKTLRVLAPNPDYCQLAHHPWSPPMPSLGSINLLEWYIELGKTSHMIDYRLSTKATEFNKSTTNQDLRQRISYLDYGLGQRTCPSSWMEKLPEHNPSGVLWRLRSLAEIDYSLAISDWILILSSSHRWG